MDTTDEKMLRDVLSDELARIGVNLGLHIELGPSVVGLVGVKFELNCTPIIDGKALSEEEESFKRLCCRYNLKPSDYGKWFKSGRHKFRVVGLRTSRPSYPVECIRDDGRIFYFRSRWVCTLLRVSDVLTPTT